MALSERDLEHLDPLRLDREIASTAESVRGWGNRVRRGGAEDEDPFLGRRLVAGKTAFLAVSDLPAGDPLRTPLRRWIYVLAEHRIQHAALVHAGRERYVTERTVSEPEHARLPLSEILARALSERPRRAAWLGAFVRAAEPLGVATSRVWERRQELASRLGETSPDAIELPTPNVRDAASRWLDRTEDAFRDIRRPELAAFLDIALGEGAAEGWPRHLVPRTILDFFRETDLFRSLDLRPGELPLLVAPASYLRALGRTFAAWVDATAPRDQPFVVAHDPFGLTRRTVGALFAGLPGTSAFAVRVLGIDRGKVRDHVRALARAHLVESRAAALRVLLRQPALSGRQAFGEAFEAETERAIGVALPRSAAGALFRLHPDDGQRFAGLLLAAARADALRSVHDEDWYRNPRATEQLRDEARLSPEPLVADAALEAGERALHTALSAAL